MHSRSLLAQVLAVNLLVIAATALTATLLVDARLHAFAPSQGLVFGGAIIATSLGNWVLLRQRFHPLDRVISSMEEIDLAAPQPSAPTASGAESADVQRLEAAFHRMIGRLEAERRQAGRAAIQAQERERERIARDLHDEVNQALTAVSLRLQATIEQAPDDLRQELVETKRLATQAMQELLAIARQLRPAVLDDHGVVAALHSQVQQFSDQTGIDATFDAVGPPADLTPEQQLVLYRVTQESLSNIAQHAHARRVEVELSTGGATVLRIIDDGRGFAGERPGGLGVLGMRERALLVGGKLRIAAGEAHGTRVEVTLP
jgi:two-component system sensor histidine kinase UhpB